jgi:hypothetical protein
VQFQKNISFRSGLREPPRPLCGPWTRLLGSSRGYRRSDQSRSSLPVRLDGLARMASEIKDGSWFRAWRKAAFAREGGIGRRNGFRSALISLATSADGTLAEVANLCEPNCTQPCVVVGSIARLVHGDRDGRCVARGQMSSLPSGRLRLVTPPVVNWNTRCESADSPSNVYRHADLRVRELDAFRHDLRADPPTCDRSEKAAVPLSQRPVTLARCSG